MTRYRTITEKDSRQERLTNFFQQEIRRRDEQALRDILSSESGRWFLMRLLDSSHVLGSCFTGNSTTFFNEGRREVGLQILRDVTNLGLEAVKLKQKAEIEYIEYQERAKKLATEYADNSEEE